jgi:hypothetical protein
MIIFSLCDVPRALFRDVSTVHLSIFCAPAASAPVPKAFCAFKDVYIRASDMRRAEVLTLSESTFFSREVLLGSSEEENCIESTHL